MLYLTSTKIISLHGQAVKTSPSHGGIWGSIPHGGAKNNPNRIIGWDYFCTPHGEKRTPLALDKRGAQVAKQPGKSEMLAFQVHNITYFFTCNNLLYT